jgi:hypothetical protein
VIGVSGLDRLRIIVSGILDGGAEAVGMRFRFGPSNVSQELGGVVMSGLLLYDVVAVLRPLPCVKLPPVCKITIF